MKYHEALDRLGLKFTSGNSVPVERATITREEWEALSLPVIITRDPFGEIVCVSRQNIEGQIIEVIDEGYTAEEKAAHQQDYANMLTALAACKQEYKGLDDLTKLGELGAYHRSVEDSE